MEKYIYLETTTEIAACVLHDLTAKAIQTPPIDGFVLQAHKIILIQNNNKFY